MLACTKSFRGLNPGLPRLMAGVLALLIVPLSLLGETVENPRLAVIMSRASFDRIWDVTRLSAHGWVGVANLAGIPYDTLFLEDLVVGEHLSLYRVLVFAGCTRMSRIR